MCLPVKTLERLLRVCACVRDAVIIHIWNKSCTCGMSAGLRDALERLMTTDLFFQRRHQSDFVGLIWTVDSCSCGGNGSEMEAEIWLLDFFFLLYPVVFVWGGTGSVPLESCVQPSSSTPVLIPNTVGLIFSLR